MANGPHMLTTFSAGGSSGNDAWTCSARLAKVRRKRSKTHSPRGPLGARRRPLWVSECAFASPWPAVRCTSAQVVARANHFSLREDAGLSLVALSRRELSFDTYVAVAGVVIAEALF